MTSYVTLGLTAVTLGVVALIVVIGYRPAVTEARGGKALAFLALFALPILVTLFGTSEHLERSKSTSFCLSCHVMEPYGESLLIDDPAYVPAVHYQNNLTPREEACYACHTSYAMFGDVQAKLNGLKHVYAYYLGTVPEVIELYQPYSNRECLHCHAGARSYEEQEDHADLLKELAANETSCLECHAEGHEVDDLEGKAMWRAGS